MNPIPFTLDRDRSTSLTEQVANGFRRAILTGYYHVGDVLPPLLEMAELLGVSSIVTRGAIKQLAGEGLVAPRPRIGIVVCDVERRAWQAQVLYLTMSGANMHYHNLLVGSLGERLLGERILFESMHISWRERSSGFPKVKTALGASQIDLAVVEGNAPDAAAMLHEHGVPFIHIAATGEATMPHATGAVLHDDAPIYKQAVDHVVACGVRSAWVLCNPGQTISMRRHFAADGVALDCFDIAPVEEFSSPMSVETGALRWLDERLETAVELPELLIFSDDFLARGALMALLRHNLRIPQNVQVITWANRNLGPVFFHPLTRLETDGDGDGRRIADFLLSLIHRKPPPERELRLHAEFIVGDSTIRLG